VRVGDASLSRHDQRDQGLDIREFKVGTRHLGAQGNAASIDPSDRQAEWLRTHQIRELRLTRVQDSLTADLSIGKEVTEECSVGLIALGALGRTDQIEGSLQGRRGQQIVVDIGDDGELEPAGQSVERIDDVGIELEPGKGIEIVGDRLRPSVDAECREGGREAVTTDLFVGSLRMPIGLDVAFFPGLPKGLDV